MPTFRPRIARRFSSFAVLILALALSLASHLEAQQPTQPLTVENIYTRPGLTPPPVRGLEWSPDGKLLSYLERTGSGENAKTDLWAIELADFHGKPRLLVDADRLRKLLPKSKQKDEQRTGLGRVTPEQYEWAPSSKALLFVSDDNLYWFDLETQKGMRLLEDAEGKPPAVLKDARISPDGKWASFVRGHDLWAVDVATRRQLRLTQGGTENVMNAELDWVYPEELDIREAYWWSPDSRHIAFLQFDERPVTKYPIVNLLSYTGETEWEAYPKAGDANPVVRVGVIDLPGEHRQAGTPRWLTTGDDTNVYLARVNWLPDSRRLAVQRLNRAQNQLDLLVVDTERNEAKVLLTERDKFWINLSDDLYFFSDGKKFLWSSESAGVAGAPHANPGGFRHLYLYDLNGKLRKQLTHGDWQVGAVNGVDEKRGYVYFTANEKSVREKHLYRVSIETGEMTRVTSADGSHSIRLSPAADFYVDTYSTALTPPRQLLDKTSSDDARVPRRLGGDENPTASSLKLQPVEFFTVPASDGTPLEAMMIRPAGFDPAKKYPAIVYLYGGPRAQLVVNAWGGSTFLFHQLLAQHGYVVFTLDNRGSYGRGHAFETPLHHRFGEVELADQLAGVEWLKKQPWVDASRIGVRGWSYGGFMTCMAMFRAPGVFKAGFAGAPVTDWRQYDTIYTERYMGTPRENPEGYKNSSPVTHAAGLRGKLLIAAGTGDDNVHFANTVELTEQLIDAGRYAELQIYPGRGHGVSDQPAQLHLFRRALQFFLDNL